MQSRILLILVTWLVACDGGTAAPPDAGVDAGPSLRDFLPSVAPADGTARGTFAGAITGENELIPGPARSGLVGDTFMRSSRARFVIQAPGRSIGIVPFGGNVIDAVLLDGEGHDVTGDQFGELGMVYLLGRTCEHERVEVLRDGSGGGAAVVRAV